MSAVTTQGFGDSATWPTCAGHPHDPRTPEMSEEMSEEMSDAHEVCAEIRLWLGVADSALVRQDFSQFAAAMETMQRYLGQLSFGEIC